MGRMATYTGKKITWDQALNSNDILAPDNLDWNSPAPVLPDENGKYPVSIKNNCRRPNDLLMCHNQNLLISSNYRDEKLYLYKVFFLQFPTINSNLNL